MSRQSDPRKTAAWERRIARFSDSVLTVARFCEREGVSIGTFHSRQRKLRDAPATEAAWSAPAVPVAHFDPVEVVSRQAGTIRFTSGAVMETPEDREDLVKAVASAVASEPQPC